MCCRNTTAELLKLEVNLERQREHLGAQHRSEFVPSKPAPQTQTPDPVPHDDYTFTLAQIVETQHQIQARHLELEEAMSLAAERLIEITRASGAAIGLLEGKKIRYRVAAGLMTLPVGSEVPMEKSLCVACLRTGEVVRCVDVNAEFLLDIEDCQRRGIRSMIAVPVYHDGGTAGGLELYYASTLAFTEHDVHSCQLMAGLITEALARDQEHSLKKSLADERAVMLEALEKLEAEPGGSGGCTSGSRRCGCGWCGVVSVYDQLPQVWTPDHGWGAVLRKLWNASQQGL